MPLQLKDMIQIHNIYEEQQPRVRVNHARMDETADGGLIKLELRINPEMYYAVNARLGHLATQDPGFLRELFATLCPELERTQAPNVQNLPRPATPHMAQVHAAKPCYSCARPPSECHCPKDLVPSR